MEKRALSMLLAVSLVLGMVLTTVPPVAAASVVASGSCGDSATWSLDSNGLMTISGSGEIKSVGWIPYLENIKKLVVEEGITSIGGSDGSCCIFQRCTNLTSVQLPTSLTYIGSHAFESCYSLTSIDIPEGVRSIGDYVFCYCEKLARVNLPSTLEKIGRNAFEQCYALESVSLADGITEIPNSAFLRCTNLKSVDMPNTLKTIGKNAFYECGSLTQITIPATVTSISAYAFHECNALKSVHITDLDAWCAITFGGYNSNPVGYAKNLYLNGSAVTEVRIPEDMENVHDFCFEHLQTLERVFIPEGVTEIGLCAFLGCTSLLQADIPDSVIRIHGAAFSGCESLQIETLPSGLLEIGSSAFYGTKAPEELVFPSSVTKVGATAFFNWDLPAVCISDLDAWCDIDFGDVYGNPLYWADALLLNGTPVTQVQFPEGTMKIKPNILVNCDSLIRVGIPDGVTEIGESAFESCGNLVDAQLPQGLLSIGSDAFWKCASLELDCIPSSVVSIGEGAFYGCERLERVVIPEGVTQIPNDAFGWCYGLSELELRDGIQSLGEFALAHIAVEELVLPEGLTSIGKWALSHIGNVTQLKIPDSVTSIGAYAFYNMYNLETVNIPYGIEAVEDHVFCYCNALKSIRIPASVTSIGEYAFYNCDNLAHVYFYGTEAQWKAITVGTNNTALKNATVHYNCDQWQDLVDMGFTLEQILTKPNIVIKPGNDEQLIYNVGEVTVSSAMGEQKVTDQCMIPLDVAITQDIVLSAEGYRDYILPAQVSATMIGEGKDNAWEPYTLNAIMQADRKDGKPYISTVFIRETGSGAPYKDARVTEYYAAKGVAYDLVVTSVGMEGKDVTYYIGQNEVNRIESTTGVFTAQQLTDMFAYGKKLYAYAQASDGTLCDPVELKLGILVANDYAYALLNSTTFSLFGDEGFQLKVADSYPILGGLELGMKCFTAPIGVDINGNQVRVSIGLDLFSASKEDNNKTEIDGIWKSFKKEFKGIQSNSEDHEKALLRYRNLKQRYDDGKVWDKIMKNRGFDVAFMGYLEGEIVNGELIFKEALVSVTGKFSNSGIKYGSLWGVPVYIASGFDGSLTATGDWARIVADRNIPVDFGISLDVNPELWIEGGAGIRNVINIGVYGKGGAPYHVNFSEKYHKWKLTGEIGIRGRLLLWTMEKPLLSGEYVLLEEYYGSPAAAVMALAADTADQTSTSVKMADRNYLENDSGWLGEAADMTLFAENVSAVDFRVLQTGVFSETKPQLAQVGGKLILTWIEDDPSRDDFNRMRLVYSVYDEASDTWSQPKAVYDDGCNDANVTLAVCGDKLVIAWQKLNTVMTAEDFSTTDPLMRTAEAYMAVYDPATDSVIQVQRITNNETFDYLPIAASVDGQAAVYYLSCLDNDLSGSANSLYLWTQEQGSVELASGLKFVQTMDAYGSCAAWITDSGVFSYSGDVTQVDTSEMIQQAMSLSYCGNSLYLSDSANIYAVCGGAAEAILEENRIIGGNLVAVPVDAGTQLYWMETGENGNELYRTTCVNGTWTVPVQISAQGMRISCVDIECYNGKLLGACNLTDAEELTALAAFTVGDIANIALDDYFYFDESQALSGNEAFFDVIVTNLGTTDVTKIVFTVTDTLGTGYTVTEAVQLPSGSTQAVTLTYPVPAAFAPTTLTVSAAISGQEDADLSDNTVSMAAGECDLSIGLKSQESAGDRYLITATVSNDSGLTAQNVGVSVILDGKTARNITIGTLNGGEKAIVEVSVDAFALDFGSDGVAEVKLSITSGTSLGYTDDDSLTITLIRQKTSCDHPELTMGATSLPTCLEQGYTQYTCTACGQTVTDDFVDALGHEHSYSVTTVPTEEAEGVLSATCSRCDDTFTVVLPALSTKSYSYCVISEPTYTEDGLGRYIWNETAYGEISIDVVLPDLVADIQKLQITAYPTKVFYTAGEALDSTGLKILVIREDGEETLLTEGFTLSGFESETTGIQRITAAYEGFTVEFTLAVVDADDLYGQLGDMAYWLYENTSSTLTVFGIGATDAMSNYGDKPWETVRSSILHIVVEDGITELGDYTFDSVSKALDVSLGNTLETVGVGCFQYCSALTSLTLPSSLRQVKDRGFIGCSGLTEVHVAELADWFDVSFENNFSNPCSEGAQLYAAGEAVTALVVPEDVTAVGDYQFYGASWLTSLAMGEGVTEIGNYAFYECTSLTELTLDRTVEDIGEYAFYGCTALTELVLDGSMLTIGRYAFYKCSALKSLTLGSRVETIGDAAFGYTALTELVLPDSVSTIGTSAFAQCKKLANIRFGSGLVTIGGFAFQECDALETVVLPDSLTEIGEYAFSYCDNLAYVTFGEGLRYIRDHAFYYTDVAFDSLPIGVEVIETYAFYGVEGAKELAIGPNVFRIESYAFSGNNNLEKLSFLGSKIVTDANAFQYCKNLKTVDLGCCEASFWSDTFKNCTGLTGVYVDSLSVWLSQSFASATASPLYLAGELYVAGEPVRELVIPSGMEKLPSYAFAGCTGLKKLTLPEDMDSVAMYAFADCTGLTEIAVPKGVRVIGSYAFEGCSELVCVVLPDSLTNIYGGAFRDCEKLNHVLFRGTSEQRSNISIDSAYSTYIKNAFWHCDASGNEVTKRDSCSVCFWHCSICKDYFLTVHKDPAQHEFENGVCALCGAIEYLQYTVSEEGVVTVTGYTGSASELILPEMIEGYPVRYIETGAFKGCTTLEEVSIPDSVTWMGEGMLAGCSALRKLTVPFLGGNADSGYYYPLGYLFGKEAYDEGAATRQRDATYYIPKTLREVVFNGKMIPYRTFENCVNLESVVLTDELTAIGQYAFLGCKGLTQLEIPASVTKLDEGVFADCTALKQITIPEGIGRLSDDLFSGCTALESVSIPQSVTALGGRVFLNCTSLKTVELPAGLTNLGSSAFRECSSLESVVIPQGVTKIGMGSFYGCVSLESVNIPSGVTVIGEQAFSACRALKEISIPQGVTEIGNYAFSSCAGLKEIVIPRSVKTIGVEAFRTCIAAESIVISDGVTKIGNAAFRGCSSLQEITIPDSVTSLGERVFQGCLGLTSVRIGSGIVTIPADSFEGCKNLIFVVLPESVTSVKSYAFYNCDALAHVLYLGTAQQKAAISISDTWSDLRDARWHYETHGNEITVTKHCAGSLFWCGICRKYIGAYNADSADHTYEDGICTICGAPQYWQYIFLSDGTVTVTGYTGPDTVLEVPAELDGRPVTAIGNNAFQGNTAITSVTVPEGVTGMGTGAFASCRALTTVILPEGLTAIADRAFYDCGSLENITVPRSVTGIGDSAFWNCVRLRSVTLPDQLTELGTYAFYRCKGLCQIRIPDAVTHIPNYCFAECDCLSEVLFGEGVNSIGYGAFRNCCALRELVFHSDAPSIGMNAFEAMTAVMHYPCGNSTWTESVLQSYGGSITWTAEHEYISQITPPGHLTEGFTTHTCSRCGSCYVDTVVPAPGHTEVVDAAVEPSCTQTGLTEGIHCDVCGEILAPQEEIPALGHSWDAGVVTLEPTEESTGIRKHTCKRCGETEEREIPNLEHVHSYEAQTVAPGCTDGGYTVYTCRCGDTYYADHVDPMGHSWDEGTVTKAPTEQTTGIRLYACTACGDTREEVLPKLEHVHNYSSVTYLPGCTTIGFTAYSCACGHTYNDQYTDPLGHLELPLKGVDATCTEPGLTEGSFCDRCMEILVEQEELPALGHSWDGGTVTLEPTEEAEGICLYICYGCGEKREEVIPQLDHVHRYESIRTEPTCTEEGFITKICSCGYSYISQTLPMLSHNLVEKGYKEPTCTEAGYSGDMVCADCGQIQELGSIIEARGHEYWRIDTAPTCMEEGFSTYTCHCGESYTDEYVPALGHSLSDWILTGSGQIYRTCFACGYDEIMDALPTVTDPAKAIVLAVDVLEEHTYEITMTDPVWGNVVCIVEADGSYTLLPESQITETGVRITLPGSCRIIVVNKALTFPDVGPNNRFRIHSDYLTARGIMSGKLDGSYGVSELIQRRTVAMVLWRLAGSPEVEGKSPFPDVTGGRYLMPVLWAYQNGIISGYTDGTFRPTDTISRQHFAIMLYRYAKWTGVELERGNNGVLEDFSDYEAMNRRMYEAMQWALDCGLINGRGNNIYDPEGYTTRGQMTMILSRYLQKYYLACE